MAAENMKSMCMQKDSSKNTGFKQLYCFNQNKKSTCLGVIEACHSDALLKNPLGEQNQLTTLAAPLWINHLILAKATCPPGCSQLIHEQSHGMDSGTLLTGSLCFSIKNFFWPTFFSELYCSLSLHLKNVFFPVSFPHYGLKSTLSLSPLFFIHAQRLSSPKSLAHPVPSWHLLLE